MTEKKQICYRELRKYKYQILEDYKDVIPITPGNPIDTKFIFMDTDGTIIVKKHYAWDGPSGPTIDTATFMRGSLVHDALYQLMREGHLDYKTQRKQADFILKQMCLEDGMSSFRAWYVYNSLRIFGEKNARPGKNIEDKKYFAP
ncbi:MAG: DUF1353 domain-containing protein [Endomicrobiales bacterium]|nr:DUF1353 domain-containing protein [Endomicrobiales bacterium]